MATLAQQQIVQTGLDPAYVAANAGGDKVQPGATSFLHAKNGSGAPITVTVDSTQVCSHGADHNLAVVVAAGDDRMIGPFPNDRFTGSDGLVSVTYSDVTTLTVASLKI